MRELYFIESEFKGCILINEQQAINVSKYLLVEDKQIQLKNIIDVLKNGLYIILYLRIKIHVSIIVNSNFYYLMLFFI